MKKTNVQPLQEVLASHVNNLGDYVENALQLFMSGFLRVTDGVMVGYDLTSGAVTSFSVGTGAIIQNGIIGELESACGLVVTLPTSGTRTDLVVARYAEIQDTPLNSNVLLNVSTREQTIQAIQSRRLGQSQISILQSTTFGTVPAGYIPLYEVYLNTTSITGYSDVRQVARITRLDEDLGLNFKLMFYSAF